MKRSSFQIDVKILLIISHYRETKISHISRFANLSHYATMERLKVFIANDIVTLTSNSNVKTYALTPKGHDFINEVKVFDEILKQKFGMDLIQNQSIVKFK
jgi:predicted transcriptional regulator